jgi:carbamoyl-phosphate synthase large subunit
MVINLARGRALDTLDQDYVARRNAVDFGLPLIADAKLAVLWVETLAAKIPVGGLEPYSEGEIPSDVRSWREWNPNSLA